VQPVLTNEVLRMKPWQYNHSLRVEGNITSNPDQRLTKSSIPTIGLDFLGQQPLSKTT
jgi:hypothetical protein